MYYPASPEAGATPEALRTQAAGWRFLAHLLSEPPDDARIEQAQAFLSALGMDAEREDGDEIRTDFLTLFVGIRRTLAPPWESVYLSRDRRVMQAPALAVRREYLSASLSHEGMFQTPDDHISLELEFLASLAERAAQALERHQMEEANQAWAAGDRFLDEHLGRWAGAFAADIQAQAKTAFWKRVARVLEAMCAPPEPTAAAGASSTGG